ncbi:MAG: GNAT family N-acetyltransferase [Patescibacteria group bacterium]
MNTNQDVVVPLDMGHNPEDLQNLFIQLTGNEKIAVPDIIKLVSATDCYCAVIEREGRAVAFGALSKFFVPDKGQYIGTIQSLVTDKQYRGKGFGTKIMTHLLSHAKTIKLKQVILTSNPKRKAANKLYKQLGFEKTNTNFFYKNL